MHATQRLSAAQISYSRLHNILKRTYGPARNYTCASCPSQAAEWSYDWTDPDPRYDVATGSQFSLDLTRYQPRCLFCHRKLDARRPVAERYKHPRQRADRIRELPAESVRTDAQARLSDLLSTHGVVHR